MPDRFRGVPALLAGTLLAAAAATALAQDSEGVSPFPIAPLPDGGGSPPPAAADGDPGGVGPFPIPGVDASPGGEMPGAAARPGGEGGRDRGSTEREVGVPPFPYDPEARGGSARKCARGCIDRRSECARAGEPARRCEGDFVLCTRDCVLAPGPADFRPPGN
jgi:hypothetical protein